MWTFHAIYSLNHQTTKSQNSGFEYELFLSHLVKKFTLFCFSNFLWSRTLLTIKKITSWWVILYVVRDFGHGTELFFVGSVVLWGSTLRAELTFGPTSRADNGRLHVRTPVSMYAPIWKTRSVLGTVLTLKKLAIRLLVSLFVCHWGHTFLLEIFSGHAHCS